MLSARQAVQNLKEYHPPLAGRDGMRLDFNENTVGCSPRVLRRADRDHSRGSCPLSRTRTGRELAARYLGVDAVRMSC